MGSIRPVASRSELARVSPCSSIECARAADGMPATAVAFGVPYAPYIDATSIALLALAGREEESSVLESLSWLSGRLWRCPSPYSLAWGILALAMYRTRNGVNETLDRATKELAALIQNSAVTDDICTLAACALAFEAVEGDNVFEVW